MGYSVRTAPRMRLWHALALVTVLWSAMFLPYLGSHEIRGEEPRRILPARTMLQNGDFVVPRVGGEIYSRKPPLVNWSIAAAFSLTGDNVWSARIPSLLWLLAFAMTCVLALKHQFGIWRATTVALFFLSCFGVLDKGRMAEIEAMYVAQTGIAFVLWLKWWSEDRKWLAYTIPWIFLGIGLLAKGPVHLLFFYPVIIATVWKAGRLREIFHPAHLLGILLMIGVFAPWAALNYQRVGSAEETSGVWLDQLMQRLAFEKLNLADWLIRPVEMAKDFLPWTVPLIWAWLRFRRNATPPTGNWDFAMWGSRFGLLFGFVLITLAPKGEARYVMPVFPIAAVILVDLLARLDEAPLLKADHWWRRINGWIAVILPIAALAAILVVPLFGPATPLLHGVGAVGVCLVSIFLVKKFSHWPALVHSCILMAAAVFLAFAHVVSLERKYAFHRPHADALAPHLRDPDRLLAFYDPENLRFLVYVHHPYVEAARIADMPENPGYLAIQTEDLELGKVQKYLKPFAFEKLAEFHWEKRDFTLLELNRRE